MKKPLLTSIAVLLLATGAAHAEPQPYEEGWKGYLIGTWNCHGVRVEFRKLMVHELSYLVNGKEINPSRVDWDQPGEKIIFKLDGKRCREVK
jgi:hypothetical protein